MPKGKPLSVKNRSAILTLHQEGYTIRKIAEKLKFSKSTVHLIINRFKETGGLEDKNRPGRSRATTSAEDQHIKLISKRNRRLTAPEIASQINQDRNKPVSVSTVKRRLQEADLHGRIATRKPLLRRGNKQKRLLWAKTHQNWSVEQWANVLWSDESKFEVFGNKRRTFVRRAKHEKMLPACVVPTIKHGGGSVIVWGAFSLAGTGDLVKIEGIMKKEHYKKILEDNVLPSGLRLIGNNFIFMHDNDPKHTSLLCRNYLAEAENAGKLKVMTWPPQSPDCNPIELLWDELDRKVRQECPTSKTQLWTLLQREWESISNQTLRKLIERMPRITRAVIKAKGGFFDEKNI